ncbi:MAG: hypothetical protein CMH55_10180 [Myxococcales bacterium]|nr:hypothetical protein [Myxococcales bacterium]
MVTVQSHHVLYRDERFNCAFPSLLMGDGEILLAFRRARDPSWIHKAAGDWTHPDRWATHVDARSHIALARLAPDSLAVRGEPEILPIDPEAGDQDPNLLRLPSGEILLSSFAWYPLPSGMLPLLPAWQGPGNWSPEGVGQLHLCWYTFWGGYTRIGSADGRQWSPHQYLPGLPDSKDIVADRRPLHGGAPRGRAVKAPDGRLLLATYGIRMSHGTKRSAHLFSLMDDGATWEFTTTIASDLSGKIEFTEPSLVVDSKDRIWAFIRSFGIDDKVLTVCSEDGGATWSNYQVNPFQGHPQDPLKLKDGRILLTYGYRHGPYGIRARLLAPDLSDLTQAPEIIIRDDGIGPDLGYPWAVEREDGSVLVAYYFADESGNRHIAGSVLQL